MSSGTASFVKGDEGQEGSGLSRRLVLLMAIGAGASSANSYYIQPLLDTLSHYFHVSSGIAGLLVTFAQLGYVLGLILIVPLGDLLERRRLVTVVTALTGLGPLAGSSPSTWASRARTSPTRARSTGCVPRPAAA